ncbi:MAG: hypothetical protein AB1585_09735 [Thermodesulfobacteriota bacterium]
MNWLNKYFMARMHPDEIEELEKPTEGERKVFSFLREVARPNSESSAGIRRLLGSRAWSRTSFSSEITRLVEWGQVFFLDIPFTREEAILAPRR